MQEMWVQSLGQEDPLEKGIAILSSILGEGNGTLLQYSCLENPMDGGAWWATVHGVAKSQTRLSNFIFTFHFHALEKVMATHSSILAWRIPGTGWVYGVAQSRTRLKQLSSSKIILVNICYYYPPSNLSPFSRK